MNDVGARAFIALDGADVSGTLNDYKISTPQDVVNDTRFGPATYAQKFIAGLLAGTLSLAGFSEMDLATFALKVGLWLSNARSGQNVSIAPVPGVGNLAIFATAIQTTEDHNITPAGIVNANVNMQVSGSSPGFNIGTQLHSPMTTSGTTLNEIINFVTSSAFAGGTITIIGPAATVTLVQNTDTLATMQTKLATAYGVTNGHIVLAGIGTGDSLSYLSGGTNIQGSGWTTPEQAFDNDHGNGGNGATRAGAAPGWIGYDLGSGLGRVANSYTIWPYATVPEKSPLTWTFQGSNDASSWTTLDTQTNVTSWVDVTPKTFSFANTTNYRYYRINVTANQAGNPTELNIGELYVFGPSLVGYGQIVATFSGASVTHKAAPLPVTSTAGVLITETAEGGQLSYYNVISSTLNGPDTPDGAVTQTSSKGCIAEFQVLPMVATSITAKIQHAVDSAGSPGSWVDLISFPVITQAGSYKVSVDPGTTINGHLRFVVSANTGNFAGMVTFARL